ncbi:MAG: ABC transporter permease [Rhodospirillaceae bacterium]|jgi:peptide/nickel transport system permease protein|nr:ABC transporter permease [Rhodospirillaceae bacterium]MBT5810462.1 ABC transporter permease [Rhodospirillaceae bacterium]
MMSFVARRLGAMALTMLVVSMAVFALLELIPGNVATMVLGPYASDEQKHLWLDAHGYLEPAWRRYGAWLANFLQGDFGDSIRFKVPVGDVLWPRLGRTAILGAAALAIIAPLSLALGVLAGMREGSVLDRLISITGIVTTSIPEFASAVLVTGVFVFWLNWLPGASTMSDGFDAVQLVLPVLVLVLYDFGYVARMTRASMIDVMGTAYIRTAILKGLPRRQVILRHALRNALIAPFTVIMLQINWLLSGVIVVEFFFAYKGFGALLLEAALNRDVFVIEACAMIAVFVAVASQALADIGYAFLNPRIRFGVVD